MKWFKNVTTVEKLRKEYRRLLKLYHPDNENGSVEVTQEINAEYDRLFAILSKETQSDNQSHAYNTDDENKAFKEVLNSIYPYQCRYRNYRLLDMGYGSL